MSSVRSRSPAPDFSNRSKPLASPAKRAEGTEREISGAKRTLRGKMSRAIAMGGIHGKTQRIDPCCIFGEQHIGLARNGGRRDAGAAPQSRQGAAELADEPPHL